MSIGKEDSRVGWRGEGQVSQSGTSGAHTWVFAQPCAPGLWGKPGPTGRSVWASAWGLGTVPCPLPKQNWLSNPALASHPSGWARLAPGCVMIWVPGGPGA